MKNWLSASNYNLKLTYQSASVIKAQIIHYALYVLAVVGRGFSTPEQTEKTHIAYWAAWYFRK